MVMLANLTIPLAASKQQRYDLLIKQLEELVCRENDLITNLSNIAAVLHHGMNFTWTGFYFAKAHHLILGPFQGVPARSRILKGEGVCGVAYAKECVTVVDDVEQFSGYIPCGAFDKSEIVLPAFHQGEVALMLNINSSKPKNFTDIDVKNLQQVMDLIEELL